MQITLNKLYLIDSPKLKAIASLSNAKFKISLPLPFIGYKQDKIKS